MSTCLTSRRISAAFFCALALSLNAPQPGAQTTRRAEFLELFARGYYAGRSGQLLIVPREGDILTRAEPELAFMHGSPWSYDAAIPMLFAGASVKPGEHTAQAAQQDVAVTLAAALRVSMPAATGRVLPVLRANAAMPRAVFLLVLDGARADYFSKHAAMLPTLSSLRKRSAWFSHARVNYIPTNTASGHSTISTGTDPRVHGVNGNNLLNRATMKRHDMFIGWNPRDLMALALADVWQLETKGKAIIMAQGGNHTSSTALAGHGACQLAGFRVLHAAYVETTGVWKTNAECFDIAPELATLDARTIFPGDGSWLGHKVDTPARIRRTALFPKFEADAFLRVIEAQPIGEDAVPDLLLMNMKSLDNVGHQYGPDSPEMRATLVEVDRQVGRLVQALEAKVGDDYILALTADHGMPAEPASQDRRRYNRDVTELLNSRFDPQGQKLISYYEPENAQIFVDTDRLLELKLSLDDIAEFLRTQPFIEAVFTENEVREAAARLK